MADLPPLPPEFMAKLKQMALHALGECAKDMAMKLQGITDPKQAYALMCNLMPPMPGVSPQIIVVEKYTIITILGKSGAISDSMYTGMLKAVDPIAGMGLA